MTPLRLADEVLPRLKKPERLQGSGHKDLQSSYSCDEREVVLSAGLPDCIKFTQDDCQTSSSRTATRRAPLKRKRASTSTTLAASSTTVFHHSNVVVRFGVELGLEVLRAQQLDMLVPVVLRLLDESVAGG